MGCIAGILFGLLQFAAVVLIAVGTPIGMYQPKNENAYRLSNNYCITMWGIRNKCMQLSYSYKPEDVWSECSGRTSRFKAAQVCAIISAIVLAVSMLASALETCCCCCIKYLCIALNVAAVVTLAVCWGCMLDCYLRDQGTYMRGTVNVCEKMRDFPGVDNTYTQGMRLGTGFILLIIAWAVSFVNIFIILIPC
ncbi:amastin-like protein [Novymonas esmeraldas]|uniref:Amastin-like protein n=1 Tax=Novymonas esmeraldas TaxID=1808958 RepID=A0AAW0ET93_9TRYP